MMKCFQKTGLHPRDEPIEDDPFKGVELANLKTIMDQIYAECSVEEYVSCFLALFHQDV